MMAMAPLDMRRLHRLCRLYGIQTAYWSIQGQLVDAQPEALLRTVQALGGAAVKFADVSQALRERRQALWRQWISPVIVAWDGRIQPQRIRLPRALSDKPLRSRIELEDGTVLPELGKTPPRETACGFDIEGQSYFCRAFASSASLPWGYHHLDLQIANETRRSLIISAPLRSYAPAEEEKQKEWGLFLPLYALWSDQSWGCGNFSDLQDLVNGTRTLGGALVGTLPLHALFLDEPFDPSPYSPVSRVFWNELYLDLAKSTELAQSAAALALVNSGDFQRELEALRAQRLIDYRRHMDLRRRVLRELSTSFFAHKSTRYSSFRQFLESHENVADYAAFRAATETRKEPWSKWPVGLRDGKLTSGDYAAPLMQYHLYAQWLAEEQMKPLGKSGGSSGLYLDFPLGVHREGYDVWRDREVFALDASGGAPPDDFFIKGQNWGFPPLHPERLRAAGYRYYVSCLRHHLRYARQLRIDHVMGLQRLYWVPHGFAPSEGVYVRYPAAEFFAILSLESHRHQAVIVGENLGTVPDSVRQGMERHRIYGMNVGQFAVRANAQAALDPIPQRNVASLNTHDTATFAGYWFGRDIEERGALGLLSEQERSTEMRNRTQLLECLTRFLRAQGWLLEDQSDPASVLEAWVSYIASGPAALVLINLEDLWLEEEPQNTPGTWGERPNWRRKARYSLEQLSHLDQVSDILRTVDSIRKKKEEGPDQGGIR